MFGFEVKNSNGQVILNSKNKLAKLKEKITAAVTTKSMGDWGTQVSLGSPTPNQIFVVLSSNNYLAFISKYIKSNGQYTGFNFFSNAAPGSTIEFYVYEIEGE